MQPKWEEYFFRLGGKSIEANGWVFSNYQAQSNAVISSIKPIISPLTQFRLIKVSGEEAAIFLQGQLSSDITEVTENRAQYSSFSSAKGRMIASFLVWQAQGAYWLMVAADIADGVYQRLSMYILRSKVQMTLINDIDLIGLKEGEETGKDVFAEVWPREPYQVVSLGKNTFIRMPSAALVAAISDITAIETDSLFSSGNEVAIGEEAWSLLDIRVGIPWITLKTQHEFVAQMANMDLIGAVNFKKGCFTGQEIIARTQYLGKLKRRLYRVAIPGQSEIGAPLFTPNMGEQSIGTVVNVARVNDKFSEALAVIQTNAWEAGVFLQENNVPLSQLTLPYTL